MIQAMYSGVAGMAAHQTKLNIIGNNIANVNTYGFKASRVVFSDSFYQNLTNASAPDTQAGGVNASQLGYGAQVGSIDVINTLGGGADTGRPFDVYINGEGYLPVADTYSDVEIKDTVTVSDPALDLAAADAATALAADPTNAGLIAAATAANTAADAATTVTEESRDPKAYEHVTAKYTRVGNLRFDVEGNLTDAYGGKILGIPKDASGDPSLGPDGTINIAGLEVIHVDPAELGNYSGISIGSTGQITGIDLSGKPQTLGYISIAKFANQDGLIQDGSGYLKESVNSGTAVASQAGSNATGNLKTSSLEMSNVDLSKEFTEMIIAQRGFQANTRIITVSDSILEELINLKR